MIEFDRNRLAEAIGGELRGATFKLGAAVALIPEAPGSRLERSSLAKRTLVAQPANRLVPCFRAALSCGASVR